MPKFLTIPTWYDKNGQLNQMLTGDARSASTGPKNVSIGENSSAGVANGSGGSVVIGYGSSGENDAVVVGALSSAKTGSIAIGRSIIASDGGIGIGGDASAGQIQLGNKSTKYDLTVGDGTGISKIGALSFNKVAPTNITSKGLYWCTALRTVTQGTLGCNAFLWIETVNSTQASAADGSVSFSYGDQGGITGWAIIVSGPGVDTSSLKCYKVFS